MKITLIPALAAACLVASLAGCAGGLSLTPTSIQAGVNSVSSAAPTIAADVNAQVTLNQTFLSQVAAANKSNAKVQAVVAKINAGQTLVAADAQVLAVAAQVAGVLITADLTTINAAVKAFKAAQP